jgi:hypothetical protein
LNEELEQQTQNLKQQRLQMTNDELEEQTPRRKNRKLKHQKVVLNKKHDNLK